MKTRRRYPDMDTFAQDVQTRIGAILGGRTNTVGSTTLHTSTASTTISSMYSTPDCHISFTPTTSDAANTVIYVKSRTNGSFVVAHPSHTTANRAYTFVIFS